MDIPSYEILFKQIKFNLRLIGIPLNGTPKKTLFLFSIFLVTILNFEVDAYILDRLLDDFLVVTQMAPCVFIGLLAISKILYIFFQRDKVFELTNVLCDLYSRIIQDAVKVECVKKEVLGLKAFTKYYFVLNVALTLIYSLSTLPVMLYEYVTQGTVTYIFPYAVIVPFRVDSFFRWFVVYMQSLVGGYVVVIFYTTVDTLYCILTCQICINFSILSNEIQNLAVNDGEKLNNIAKRHQYLLELSQDLEDIFTGPNFFNVLSQSLIICSLLFNLNAGDVAAAPGCVVFLSSTLLQILMMSFFGENLKNESEKIGNAAFLCPWYKMSECNKKTIIIIRQRSLRPQVLTAYKFSVIGYASFSKIIRTSWSFFTLLNTVYDTKSVN